MRYILYAALFVAGFIVLYAIAVAVTNAKVETDKLLVDREGDIIHVRLPDGLSNETDLQIRDLLAQKVPAHFAFVVGKYTFDLSPIGNLYLDPELIRQAIQEFLNSLEPAGSLK